MTDISFHTDEVTIGMSYTTAIDLHAMLTSALNFHRNALGDNTLASATVNYHVTMIDKINTFRYRIMAKVNISTIP